MQSQKKEELSIASAALSEGSTVVVGKRANEDRLEQSRRVA